MAWSKHIRVFLTGISDLNFSGAAPELACMVYKVMIDKVAASRLFCTSTDMAAIPDHPVAGNGASDKEAMPQQPQT